MNLASGFVLVPRVGQYSLADDCETVGSNVPTHQSQL
jgi:hypothetical protein